MIRYFSQGFSLLNKNIKLGVIFLVLQLISGLPNMVTQAGLFGTFVGIIASISLVISFVFWPALYKFFFLRMENKEVTNQLLVKETLMLARRLIVPAIILILFTFLIIAILTAILLSIGVDFSQNSTLVLGVLMFPLGVIGNLLVFTGIYFVIEKKSFWSSIKQSIAFALKNLKFVAAILVFSLLTQYFYLLVDVPGYVNNIVTIIVSYVNLGILATVIIYHHSKKKIELVD